MKEDFLSLQLENYIFGLIIIIAIISLLFIIKDYYGRKKRKEKSINIIQKMAALKGATQPK